MNFTLRYWWFIYKGVLKGSLKIIAVFAAFTLFANIMTALPDGITASVFINALTHFLLLCVIFYFFMGLITLLIIQHKRKYYEIVDKKGYCMEAFNYYQQNYILGKPVNENDYIEFAELYQKFGDYDSAIRVLDSIKVPESNKSTRAIYIFEYMTVAVLKNDAALADDIWRLNSGFINSVVNDPKMSVSANALYLVMIYADCIAGRYERAFQICRDFLNGNHIKKYKTYKENFLVLKIYLLKKLGRESEINTAITEFNNYDTKKWKPLFDATRTDIRNNVEKAIRGEMPV